MTTSARELLDSFDHLPDHDRRIVYVEIPRRTAHLELPPLDDEGLSLAAEELFLELDAREADIENGVRFWLGL